MKISCWREGTSESAGDGVERGEAAVRLTTISVGVAAVMESCRAAPALSMIPGRRMSTSSLYNILQRECTHRAGLSSMSVLGVLPRSEVPRLTSRRVAENFQQFKRSTDGSVVRRAPAATSSRWCKRPDTYRSVELASCY